MQADDGMYMLSKFFNQSKLKLGSVIPLYFEYSCGPTIVHVSSSQSFGVVLWECNFPELREELREMSSASKLVHFKP